tara:strand:- start:323 stop:1378 length:1056 start_codon:yes stop_codon:yes gene_type:complete
MFLGTKEVSQNTTAYVIAEIGVNHEGDMKKAKKLIKMAKDGGANAAKFQSYKAGTLASKNSPSYWDRSKEPTESQYKLFKKFDKFGKKEFIELSDYCNYIGIDFLSTPFDDESIEFLDPIVPFFKIASADLTNIPFLRKIALKKKPVILSTGASNLAEIEIAINTIKEYGCKDIVLLHCILNYPTDDQNANLLMISGLKKTYPNYLIGYSDHTLPDLNMTSLITAYTLGAKVIEKHFTHDKTLNGNDHYHAMDQKDLSKFIKIKKKIDILLGNSEFKKPLDSETISRKNARRSIVSKKHLIKGQIISSEDITYKRPGTGISPLFWDDIIGMKINKNIEQDQLLSWQDLENK